MNKKNLYIDIHVLQTVPPSCINRDDMGSPKTAVYGGVVRARVSSQSWKHEMRKMFVEIFGKENVGFRTKKVLQKIAEKIGELDNSLSEEACEKKAEKALKNMGINLSKKNDNKTEVLMFLSDAQARAVASLVIEGNEDKKEYQAALRENPAVDIALFGRMVASDPSLNFDAAAQVAHAISTHKVQNEYDYFTAVDDIAEEDNSGAGHLGTVEYNSSTLYRYATVNVKELSQSLGNFTSDAVKGFVEAFVQAMPAGKQNTFANRTCPDFVYVALRTDQPVNLCGAFEKPVISKEGGYLEASEKAFLSYAAKIYENYAAEPQNVWGFGDGLTDKMSFPQILEAVQSAVKEKLSESEAE